MLKDR